MSWKNKLVLLLFAAGCLSCASKRMWLNTSGLAVETKKIQSPVFTIYAIGDTGLDNEQSRAVIGQLASVSSENSNPGMIVFLGDNVYPAGLAPPSDTLVHLAGKLILEKQIDVLKNFPGEIIFLPGNHDWNAFKPGGLEAIRRQGDYLKSLQDPRIRLLPANGCGGPEKIQLTDEIVLLILDSQWWIQDWTKEPGINKGCDVQSKEQLIAQLKNLIQTHQDQQIVLAMHHPLHTRGHHGGYFTFKDHMFPLTKVVKWMWIPLPVVGSIYPWYRSVLGHPQDIRHPRYKSLKQAIMEDLNYEGEIIFLAGHDHNLQYIYSGEHHHLLSGGGAKQNHVANGRDLIYGHKAAGFMQIDFFSDRGAQLTIFEVNPGEELARMVLRKTIIDGVEK